MGGRPEAETVLLGEHHGDPGGYLASPIVLAAAILGRTRGLTVHLSALVAPAVRPCPAGRGSRSLIAPGRVEVTLGIGYRPHECDVWCRALEPSPTPC